MRGHADGDNLIELAIIVEFGGYMAVMIIDYQHSIHIGRATFCMLIKMLDPIQASFVVGLFIWSWFDHSVIWKIWVCGPVGEVINVFYNHEQRNAPAWCVDAFNDCSLFLITRLDKFCFFMSIRVCNYHKRNDYTHHEAGFIEIVKIFRLDSILGYHVAQQHKPTKNHGRIFVQCFLIIVKMVEFSLQ